MNDEFCGRARGAAGKVPAETSAEVLVLIPVPRKELRMFKVKSKALVQTEIDNVEHIRSPFTALEVKESLLLP